MMEQLGAMALSAAAVAPVQPSPPAGLGWERLGEYRILREVARGGMGVVYEAVQESLGRHVALKILPGKGRLTTTQIERFRLEARSAGRLHHSNIVPVHGVGEHEGVHYYAMQFIEGHGLDAILDDLRRLRGLVEGTAVSCTQDRTPPGTGDPNGSMALARSLVTGGFGSSAAAVDRTGTREPSSDQTIPLGAASEQSATTPGIPRSREATAAAPSLSSTDSSALSLTIESQFYRSVTRIGIQVADALTYAHQQGVLHRDIKPSNLMLDIAGHVWVTDFGLAKLEGSDGPTRTGDIVGTVRYMAPERFDGWSDRRSDVYSLGATLYELLTLRPLFPGAAQAELIEKVLHAAPEPPRKLDPAIPRDLETIVLKAIAKEPGDRYATAQAIGEDLKRFLEDRPVLARRSTPVERFWRWCRRNPGLAAANITAAALTTILAIVSTIAAWTYRDQRDLIGSQLHQIEADRDRIRDSEARERQARSEARQQLYQALYDQARAGRFGRQVGQRFQGLEALRRAAAIAPELEEPSEKLAQLRDEVIACLALPDLKPTGRVIARPQGIVLATFDPTLTRYALRFKDGTIQVRRVADDQEVARFQARGDRDIFVFRFSPDGRYLTTTHQPDLDLTVWDVVRRTIAVKDPGPVSWGAARFSPDSRRLAVAHADGEFLIYDLATGQPRRRWRERSPSDPVFSPDGTLIALMDHDGRVYSSLRILEAESGRIVRSIPIPQLPLEGMVWSPDGATLATTSGEAKIYLWDATTTTRKATLDGLSGGASAAFHPSGALLASTSWDGRMRLWDPVLGRTVLTLTDYSAAPEFSRDGRIVVSLEDHWTIHQVDPALEYRTLAHAFAQQQGYGDVTIRADGRMLALGTHGGVVLWDLARSTELAVLPIGTTQHLRFEASGDLLTSGATGVQRWPIRCDAQQGQARIGPPHPLRLPVGFCGIDEDPLGRIVAKAAHTRAYVQIAERAFHVGPLDDVRSVAISPDGEWLATGSHGKTGAQVWRIRDAVQVAHLAIDGFVHVQFSRDGKWLMTTSPPCRLWAAGTWHEVRQIGGRGLTFSPDSRQVVVQDSSRALRLVETETGRTLARLESPDACQVDDATFSPDGSRLVVTTNDGPAVHIWDLRAIRRQLTRMGLDWDAPAYSDDDPAADSSPPLPSLQVDFGKLADHLEHYNESPETLLQRYTKRLQKDPDDAAAYHHRAHALAELNRLKEAGDDLTRAIRLRPDDLHSLIFRAEISYRFQRYQSAITDLEAALARDPGRFGLAEFLAVCCNNLAWELAKAPEPRRELDRALGMIRRAQAVAPDEGTLLNTLGVVHYRAGRYSEAITTLERSLAAGRGLSDGFDLFFLAMAHHRLGHRDQARECFDRGVRWSGAHTNLDARSAKELAGFRAEAEAVLAGAADEVPDDVFANP